MLPRCIKARRIGYGTESSYDEYGNEAPVMWFCNCGARLALEILDHEEMSYTDIPLVIRQEFLQEHSKCTAVCYVCQVSPVEEVGYWCEECEANAS